MVAHAFCVVLSIVPTGGGAAAQTFTADVRGAVRESGGIVPGVAVCLVNEATGAVRETLSNDVGEYDLSAVPPGTYTVRATRQDAPCAERVTEGGGFLGRCWRQR